MRPQFTIRAALVVTLFVALAFGWYTSARHAKRRLATISTQLTYFQAEQGIGKSRADFQARGSKKPETAQGVLSQVRLEGVNLQGATLSGGLSAFWNTSFENSDLRGATLSGASSAFQGARFDNAQLTNANLTGGSGSFQFSSFDGADLSGADLKGGAASFQGASFQGANLIGARVIGSGGSFQLVNIDGAQFQGADLSAVDRNALESCYFKSAPSYDENTRFPINFDPSKQLWIRSKTALGSSAR